MSINPFRKSTIRKIDSKFFKEKTTEREELARSVGDRGLSREKMNDRLRAEGYDPKKRGALMGQVLGVKKAPGLSEEQKKKNILGSRRAENLNKTEYTSSRVAFGGRGVETRSRVALGKPSLPGVGQKFGASPVSNPGLASPGPLGSAGLGPKRFL